jgi:hypothetical protein
VVGVRSIRRSIVVATAALAVVLAGQGMVLASSGVPASKYVKAVPVCKAAKPHHATCDAMRLVTVKPSTPGAHLQARGSHPAYTTGLAGGFTPADLATAYGVNANAATTKTVAIVDAHDDPNALADLNTFNTQYGLPLETASSFRKVNQLGDSTPANLPVADSGWALEISLDLDAVRGLCHKCKIILVEANSNSFADLGASVDRAVTMGADVVSNSYGGGETGAAIPTGVSSHYDHPGTVILVSTGDHGLFDWDEVNAGPNPASAGPEIPSSLKTVVAVGGTTMYLNGDATRSAETVWNENGSADQTGLWAQKPMGATGGGCSTVVTAQLWQKNVANYAGTTCGTKRLAADISALADPYTGYDIYDSYGFSGWLTLGGTSLASPLVAAMWALAGGSGGVAYPSLSLYGHFKSDATHPLYDVTAGGNGICDGTPPGACDNAIPGAAPNTLGFGVLDCAWVGTTSTLASGTRECDAATGYDGPSGVGTPKGLNAFKPMKPTAKITAPVSITHGHAASFSGTSSTDPFPGGSIATYAWKFGDGGVSTLASPSHSYSAAGTFTVTLTVKDNYGQSGTVTKSVTVH